MLGFEGCLAEIAAVCTGDPLIGGPDVEHKEILAQEGISCVQNERFLCRWRVGLGDIKVA